MGSSPLTRGAREHGHVAAHRVRIIPAHAGCTLGLSARPMSRTDHPRSRGVHPSPEPFAETRAGSSPLTRGARVRAHVAGRHDRIIPAHAGCTPSPTPAPTPSGDHPRSRGVHGLAADRAGAHAGSSPLTRGALDAAPNGDDALRIIPAHAGCTARRPCSARPVPDHPRSRGVHVIVRLGEAEYPGSSPLTRGARVASAGGGRRRRIIPAHAGCTIQVVARGSITKDHPRSRGVHELVGEFGSIRPGSSPLTRGARGRGREDGHVAGIIPAHAGCTWSAQGSASAGCGSSPLTRGAQILPILASTALRIIPAHAGCTLSFQTRIA